MATDQNERLQQELTAAKKELETAPGGSAAEQAAHAHHEFAGILQSARDIVGMIAQTLRQPEPPAASRSSASGSQVSVGEVMSTMNTACTVALAAQHAWDVERCALEDKAQQAVTRAMNATKDASSEKVALKEELMKLQGRIKLLEQREVDLLAAQERAKVKLQNTYATSSLRTLHLHALIPHAPREICRLIHVSSRLAYPSSFHAAE